MPIQTSKNLYRGVNPHLNSFMQRHEVDVRLSFYDRSLHVMFLFHVYRYLNQHLPSAYLSQFQRSLQSISDGDNVQALVIRPAALGKISPEIARIELPLLMTKLKLSRYKPYLNKRLRHLRKGILFIEIDLLHETKPTFKMLPTYPEDDNSYPYFIILNNPRQAFDSGTVQVYGFKINEPFPTVKIQLADEDTIDIPFDAIYQDFFESQRMYMLVDYTQLPERFDTYSPDDQQRIKARMAEITQEYGGQPS